VGRRKLALKINKTKRCKIDAGGGKSEMNLNTIQTNRQEENKRTNERTDNKQTNKQTETAPILSVPTCDDRRRKSTGYKRKRSRKKEGKKSDAAYCKWY
jgi:hypothetical protein